MEMITGYFIDPGKAIAEPRTIEKSLEGYYALLRCDCIDIPSRTIGGRRFDIVCDDEGLLKSNPIISAYDTNDAPMLVGPIFVVKFNGKDDVISLTEEDLDYVASYVKTCWAIIGDGANITQVLTELDY